MDIIISLNTQQLLLKAIAKTSSSTCFDVLKNGENSISRSIGWIDIHYSCEEHIRVRIRGAMPDSLLNSTDIQTLVHELFQKLQIPSHETWDLNVCSFGREFGMCNSVDLEGYSDRVETTRKFRLPE